MWSSFAAADSPPESLLPRLSGACLTVRKRLGPGRSRECIVGQLLEELGHLGFARVKTRSFRRGCLSTAGIWYQREDCFDLVVEARSVIEFAHPGSPDQAAGQLAAFEDRLTRYGWEEGLLVDFDQTDPIDGLWIVRNPGDFLTPQRPERVGTN
jgi:hypothetical protein